MPITVDGKTIVADFAELDWNVHVHGTQRSFQVCVHVVEQDYIWAIVVVVMRESRKAEWLPDLRYHVTRWRRLGGAWHLQERFRLREHAFRLLVGQHAEICMKAEAVEPPALAPWGPVLSTKFRPRALTKP